MKNFWKSFGWFWMSALPMVLCLILQFAVAGVVMAIFGLVLTAQEQLPSQEAYMEAYYNNMMKGAGTGILTFQVVNLAVFGLWYFLAVHRKKRLEPKPRSLVNVQAVGLAVLFGISLCFFTNQLVTVGGYLFPQVIEAFYRLMEQAGFGVDLAAVIAAIFLAPIGEELLCRGVIQYYAGKVSRRFWVVNMLQALMFGIMHANLVQGIYAFCIGLVMGWLRFRYHSLVIPIIIHFVVNLSSSTWIGKVLALLPTGLWINIVILFAAIGVTAMGLVLVEKSQMKVEEEKNF